MTSTFGTSGPSSASSGHWLRHSPNSSCSGLSSRWCSRSMFRTTRHSCSPGSSVWTWLQSSLDQAAGSIVDNRELVRLAGFPVAILPIVTVAANLTQFLFALPILALFLWLGGGVHLTAAPLLLPVLIAIQFLVILSIAYFVAALQVTFRDVKHLLQIAIMLGFYLTPVFYELHQAPPKYATLYQLNPMVHLIGAYRAILLHGTFPAPGPLAAVAAASVVLLLLRVPAVRARKFAFRGRVVNAAITVRGLSKLFRRPSRPAPAHDARGPESWLSPPGAGRYVLGLARRQPRRAAGIGRRAHRRQRRRQVDPPTPPWQGRPARRGHDLGSRPRRCPPRSRCGISQRPHRARERDAGRRDQRSLEDERYGASSTRSSPSPDSRTSIDNPLRTFSTGMRMRLAFAVATVVEPEILLVDEILGVGDIAFQHKCAIRIQELRSRGSTLVVCSHSGETIREICDAAVWLEKGEVRQRSRRGRHDRVRAEDDAGCLRP